MEQKLMFNRVTRNFVRYEAPFKDGAISGSLYIPLAEIGEPYPPEIVVKVATTVPARPTAAPVKKAPAKRAPATKAAPAQKTAPRKRPAK